MIDSVLTCAKVHIALMDNPPAGGEPFVDEIDDRLQWYIHAIAFFFPQQIPFPAHADDAASGLAVLGMILLSRNRLNSAKECGIVISTLAANCTGSQPRPYLAGDLYENLEILAQAAEAFGYMEVAREFRSLVAKPPTVTEADWQVYRKEIATRLRQLNRALGEFDRGYAVPDDPVSMLRATLAQRAQPESAGPI